MDAKHADACEANATSDRSSSILSLTLDGGTGDDRLTLLLEDRRAVTLESGAVVRVVDLSIGSRVSLEGGQFGSVTAIRRTALPSRTEQLSTATTPSTVRFARVIATVVRQTRAVVNLRTAAGLTQTTPEHPFARKGGGWTPASELRVGDEIVTAAAEAPATVLAVETQLVPPSRVYNLSVEPSHVYFVGGEAMLVHNTPGCVPRPGTLAVNDHLRTQSPRVSHNNCSYCSRTALQDERTVSDYLMRPDQDVAWDRYLKNPAVAGDEIVRSMGKTGLIVPQTTRHGSFSDLDGTHREGTSFMQNANEDTFLVGYFRRDPYTGEWSGHAVTAVRQADGRILYIDFQQVPPISTYNLAPDTKLALVVPAAVEWRYNRQLTAGVERATPVDMFH
jgi:hypothetical protein